MALDLFAGIPVIDDLSDRVAEIARRGIEPAKRETYDSGVTKVTYRDADGNEISFGGSPADVIPAPTPDSDGLPVGGLAHSSASPGPGSCCG